MIFTRRYHTKSGSIYEVRTQREGADKHFVRRVKLGDRHASNPECVARRKSDGLDEGRVVDAFADYGVGYQALIVIDGKTLLTNVVTAIEEVV